MTTSTCRPTGADAHARRRHEAPELGSAVARFMRALVRRAGEGDTEALEQLVGLEGTLRDSIAAAGRSLHDDAGYSYGHLAEVLGVSRQAARVRFAANEPSSLSCPGSEPPRP